MFAGIEVLIVEDSVTQAEKLRYFLETSGFRVYVAYNGKEAFDILSETKPNIVISDIIMPEMDGYKLCRKIRKDEALKDIPVILLTFLSDPKDVIKGLESGANNFIVKPYNERYLLSRIQYLLANIELRKNAKAEIGINVFFSGENYFITAERLQILDLLLSTYENAYYHNIELIKTRNELKELNEQLEKKVEERTIALKKEINEHKKTEKALLRVNRALKTLNECNQALVHAANEKDLLDDICRIIVENGGYRLAWVGFALGDETKTVRPVAQAGYEGGYIEAVYTSWADDKPDEDPIGKAVRTGKACIVQNILTETDYATWHTNALKCGFSSFIALPLIIKRIVIGALNIYAEEPDAFDTEEVALLTELANDLAYGISALRTRAEGEHAEEALHESMERYHNTLDNMLEGCQIIGFDWRYLYVNNAAARHGRRTKEELLGHTMVEIYPGMATTDLFAVLQRCMAERSARHIENEFAYPDGVTGCFELSIQPVPEGLFILSIDITERKKAEEKVKEYTETLEEKIKERMCELEFANAELESMNEELQLKRQEAEDAKLQALSASMAKSDFLANMSHELRTPLNSIIGFSEILQDEMYGKINDRQREYINDILGSGRHLLSLINDILDLSKVESGKMELQLGRFLLKDALDASMIMFREKAMKHNIGLSLTIEPESNIEIEADERKLKQILFNLLSNAIKFTPDGGAVSMQARLLREDEGRGMRDETASVVLAREARDRPSSLMISVGDTGIGIRPEDMDMLFKEFSQLESPYEKKHEGTGLGLALTKKLVELQGGMIWAESEYGKGSKFTFMIPTQQEGRQ